MSSDAGAAASATAPTSTEVASGSDMVASLLAGVSSAVSGLVNSVLDYAKTNETAAAFLEKAVAKAQESVKIVKRRAEEIRDVPLTELPVLAVMEALNTSKAAIAIVVARARDYDEEYKVTTKLTAFMDTSKEAAAGAIAEAYARISLVLRGATGAAGSDAGSGSGAGADSGEADAGAGGGEGGLSFGAATVSASLTRAQQALEALVKRVLEHDSVADATKKASAVLSGALDVTRGAATEVQRAAQALREANVREVPAAAARAALERANSALSRLTAEAKAYDDEYKLSSSLASAIESARGLAFNAVAEARVHLEAASTFTTDAATSATDAALRQIIVIDERFGVTETATAIAGKVVGHARELDEKLGVTSAVVTPALAAATKLDERTGGYGAAAVAQARTLVDFSVEYVANRLAGARLGGADAGAADGKEGEAATATATDGAGAADAGAPKAE